MENKKSFTITDLAPKSQLLLETESKIVNDLVQSHLYQLVIEHFPSVNVWSTFPTLKEMGWFAAKFRGSTEDVEQCELIPDKIVQGMRIAIQVNRNLLISDPIKACRVETPNYNYQVFE